VLPRSNQFDLLQFLTFSLSSNKILVVAGFAIAESREYIVTKLKLILADKRGIFREGLAKLLEPEPSMEVVGTCCTGGEVVESANEHQPDVVLIDTELSECSSIEAIERIHERLPKTRIMVLTHSEVNAEFLSTVRAGAKAYISKDISLENLIKAIILVAEGEVVVSPPMAAGLLAEFNSLMEGKEVAKLGDVALLSKREQAVLSLVAQGFTNREIATTLVISEHTVKVHMRNIMEKLNAHTRQQAVALAGGIDLLSVTETSTNPM